MSFLDILDYELIKQTGLLEEASYFASARNMVKIHCKTASGGRTQFYYNTGDDSSLHYIKKADLDIARNEIFCDYCFHLEELLKANIRILTDFRASYADISEESILASMSGAHSKAYRYLKNMSGAAEDQVAVSGAAQNRIAVSGSAASVAARASWNAAGGPWNTAGASWNAAGTSWNAAGGPWNAAEVSRIAGICAPTPYARVRRKEKTISPKSRKSFHTSENPYRPEDLKHTTHFGLKVRSKGESMIAEALFLEGIIFYYEKRLSLVDKNKNRVNIYPDFTIDLGKGHFIYWEHKGMMGNDEYAARDAEKDRLYFRNEIYQPENLIVTCDGPNGESDMRNIKRIITGLIIPRL